MPPPHLETKKRQGSAAFSTVIAFDQLDTVKQVSEPEERRLLHVHRTAEYLVALGLPSPLPSETKGQVILRLIPSNLERPQNIITEGKVEPPPKRLRSDGVQRVIGNQLAHDDCDEETLSVEASRQWLRETRAILLKPGLAGPIPTVAGAWRWEAVRRWGSAVPAEQEIQDWEEYVRSRLPTPPAPSPFDLMQERYASDMWRMIAACALMTRISSEKVKEESVSAFFQLCPTPTELLSAMEDSLRKILRPLGMVDGRIKTLRELSKHFLSVPCFDCGHQKGVNKIWGCGPFVVDSFNLFCKGRCDIETSDATCEQYLSWWRDSKDKQPPLSDSQATPARAPRHCDGGNDKEVQSVEKVKDSAAPPLAVPSGQLQQSSLLKYFKAA
eukprot:gnl/MRDRNA2_/MRDRNA2_66988_c0_seq1.p1 gnl/MRDRNA2_/MRDRNA2_66988_c0~~gnl/MRDRNA2_/MRDRNA2_66988_c0_seq1.p1  ORF type:complete len:385 (-),score=68.66 gnl/MRDRNA2_/MRDRNA2_66988_c0_seq1:100-1254(-)